MAALFRFLQSQYPQRSRIGEFDSTSPFSVSLQILRCAGGFPCWAHGLNQRICRSSIQFPHLIEDTCGASRGLSLQSNCERQELRHLRDLWKDLISPNSQIAQPPLRTSINGLHWWQAHMHLPRSGAIHLVSVTLLVQRPQPTYCYTWWYSTAFFRLCSVSPSTIVVVSLFSDLLMERTF